MMATPRPVHFPILDLRGGINDSDSPTALLPTQVTTAFNVDYRQGQLAYKRHGSAPLSMTGSILARDRPQKLSENLGGWTATNTVTYSVSAVSAPADGTTNTNHLLVVMIATKVATAINTVTLGGVALTRRVNAANGLAGQVELWTLASPALVGGSLVVTAAGVCDGSVVAQRWNHVDNGVGITNTGSTSNTLAAFEDSVTGLWAQHLFISAVAFNGAAGSQTATVTTPAVATAARSDGTARLTTAACLGAGTTATTQTTALAWTFSASLAYVAGHLVIKGRAAVIAEASATGVRAHALLHHTPSNNTDEDELWVVDNWGRIDRYVAGAWAGGVPTTNALNGSFGSTQNYLTNGVSAHGKFFLAVPGALADRCLVWDGTVLRWAGFNAPLTGSAANTGGGAYAAVLRYYRYRWVERSGTAVLRRSEPSPVTSFTPSGAGTGVIFTRGSSGQFSGFDGVFSEGATDWEIEASTDNVLFYRLSTVAIATATYTDSAVTSTYASNTLSESLTEYLPLAAFKHVVVDEDRVLGAGCNCYPSTADTKKRDSRVSWTVLTADDGVGNDERVPATSRHFLDLDPLTGGGITAAVAGVLGAVYVFKQGRIYKLLRTGKVAKAYDSIIESRSRGALMLSAQPGTDFNGNPTVYFVDGTVGACSFGVEGLQDLMQTRRALAARIDKYQSVVGARTLFFPEKWLVWFWLTLDAPDNLVPTLVACYNVRLKSWTDYTGPLATSVSAVLFPAWSTGLNQPILAPDTVGTSPITIGDSGFNDDGVRFRSYIVTKPYALGGLYTKFGVAGALITAQDVSSGAVLGMTLSRDENRERKATGNISLLPDVGPQQRIYAPVDDARLSECHVVQIEIGDPDTFVGAQLDQHWAIDGIVLRVRVEDEATA